MKPAQFIGYTLLNASAITNITSTRINNGTRPNGEIVPCINYFQISGNRFYGMENALYSINCRANDPIQARDIAREVVSLFAGTSGQGVYGTQNGFTVSRASLSNDAGLIPEPDDDIYNAPVDILIVYPGNTVS